MAIPTFNTFKELFLLADSEWWLDFTQLEPRVLDYINYTNHSKPQDEVQKEIDRILDTTPAQSDKDRAGNAKKLADDPPKIPESNKKGEIFGRIMDKDWKKEDLVKIIQDVEIAIKAGWN